MGKKLRIELLVYWIGVCLILWETARTFSNTFHHRSMRAPFAPHLHQHFMMSLFLVLAILTDVQWYPTVVYFPNLQRLITYWPFIYLPLWSVCSNIFPFILICLPFIIELQIFKNILDLSSLSDVLQVFSPAVWLASSFSWQCLW